MAKELQKCIRTASTVMDVDTPGIWQLFAATDWNVSDTYEKLHECGIGIDNQRTGSLLNFCAARSVGTVKTLEPDMYAKINARFNNVEFIASFSKSGYYNIAKPKDCEWSGSQHIKAGVNDADNTALTNKYATILKDYGLLSESEYNALPEEEKPKYHLSYMGIYGERKDNTYKFKRSIELTKKLGSALTPITPLKTILENWDNWGGEKTYSKEEIKKLSIIHTTWYDYCLFMLNNSEEPAKSIWREKLITSILSWKYSTGSVEPSTIDALNILSELSPELVMKVTDDYWTKEDFNIAGLLPISGKTVLSLSHYPQESLEKEAQMCISHILENGLWDEIEKSEMLKKMVEKFEETDVKTMLTPTQTLILKYGNENVKQKNHIDENTEKKYEEIIRYEDIKDKLMSMSLEELKKDKEVSRWLKRVSDGNLKWFKESIHSTSSWKRYTICIMKNDISGKYLGFGPSSRERLARANAMQAFSQKQEEKEKAKAEALRLAKKIEEENSDV